jgi:mannose-6-phosphate isomerase-like protein (cupin superfamily)
MITKLHIDVAQASPYLGMPCQRLIPWGTGLDEPPLGAVACFLDPGHASSPDVHSQDEVMVVLSGSGTVRLDDEQAPIAAGEVVVLERNRTHVVSNDGDGQLSWVALYWPLHEPDGS